MSLNPLIKDRKSPTTPAGEKTGTWLALLNQGANLLQSATPLKGFDVYVVGFHCAKGEPDFQMEAHHFCKVVNEDLLQCVLFDGNTAEASLIGIEYIISGRLFDAMPDEEKPYWHPHNFEVLSGQLVAPGLPEVAEKALMKHLVNSYGKTWHTWHTNPVAGHPGMKLPYGDPKLMWSFNRDGEGDEGMRRDRDEAMSIDADAKRADRQQAFSSLVKPQCGVDAMLDDFPGSTPVPGVIDVRAASSEKGTVATDNP